MPNKKKKNIVPNLANIKAPKASPSQTPSGEHLSVTPPHTNTNEQVPCRHDPLSVGFANVFADKHISWVQRSWKNVCSILPKQGFLCGEEIIEPDLHFKESSPQVKCCHQSKLEVLPPLERHILLFMSKQPLLKGHVFLHADNNTLHCKCAHSLGPNVDCQNLDDACASSVGIFLQAYAKDGVNLAHRLMDGKWTRRRLHTLAFARLRGEPGMICANAAMDFDETSEPQLYKEALESPLALLHRISLRAFKERILHGVPQQQLEFPDKEMLDSVQDFFLYTEFEGRQVFEELDRDADGKLTMDDVKVAMQKMKLPADYAKDFMHSRCRLWPSKSFGWSEFSSMIQEKEPIIIQLFNSLGVSKSGTVNRLHIKDSLKKAGLSATEANITAMMKFLATDTGEYIKYGQFRRFMLLLPTEQLTMNPWSVWLKAATVDSMKPSSEDWQVFVFKYITSLPHTFQLSSKEHRFESQAIPL